MKTSSLGPHGLLNQACLCFSLAFGLGLVLRLLTRQYLPGFFESHKDTVNLIFFTLPLVAFFMPLSVGLWRYLFKLANYVQTLRDFSVTNIEHLRLRVAELTPENSNVKDKEDAPLPAAKVPRLTDESSAEDRQLGKRERETMLKLLIGMAMRGYSHDPTAAKSSATKEIADDLASLGINVSDDTVRKYLKQAADTVLPANPRQS